MSKKCPNCSEELKDDALVCEKCGQELAPEEEPVTELAAETETAPEEEPVTELAAETETAPEEEPVTVLAAEEADESEDAETVTQEAGDAETPADPYDNISAYQSEIDAKPAKKPLSFGLGLGIGIGIAALIAAIVCGIMMIIASTGPAPVVDKYIKAYKDGNFEDYYSYDYSVMYKYQDLDTRVQQAEQFAEATNSDGLETKVIKTIPLSKEAKDSLVSQLETAEYKDVDKIEDVNIVILEVSNSKVNEETGEADDSQRDSWISVIYAIKVDGSWYFTSSF